jgi:formamidopyrimidine-DNA glycosylase
MARRNLRPEDLVDRLIGRVVESIGRHGKFIEGSVEGDITLVIHLGMSGRLQLAERGDVEQKHTNVVVSMESDTELRMVDPRTFGFVAAFTPEEFAASSLSKLGRDAWLDLPQSEWLAAAFAGRTAPVKALLLDQRILAGLGNIYADEVLHASRINPLRPGGGLSLQEVEALRASIPAVLEAGIEAGGTSLDDLAYLLPDGRAGEHMDRLAVYGRTDEPCVRCGTPIERMIVAQRSSHFCPSCQPREPG